MKTLFFFILTIVICIEAFTQDLYKRIRVNNDIELIMLSENAYVHVTTADMPPFGRFPSNGLLLKDGIKAILFDTPVTDSLTEQLIDYVKDSLKLQVVSFAPNHWHNDCMGGLKYLQSINVETYGNKQTIDIGRSKGLPVPQNGFSDSLILKVGSNEAYCYYLGAGHTLDNIVVWVPSEQILFAGCMVKEMSSKGLGNIADADLKAWPVTLNKVLVKFYSAKIVIPGHGKIGSLELIKHSISLF